MNTPQPAVAWRALDARPNLFRLTPCCDAARGRTFVNRHGSVDIDVMGIPLRDVLFCPWCGKPFEVRVRRRA